MNHTSFSSPEIFAGKGKPMGSPDANNVSKKELKGKEFVIDIPPDLEPAQWPECCIYRVPKKLRRVNECAYTPKLISIGPFHHGNEDLGEMEMQKMRYFQEFCSRTRRNPKDLSRDLGSIIERKESQIRRSYAEKPKQDKNQFVKMIILDAIFIIELVLRNSEKLEEKQDEHILSKPWLRNAIQLDLILLENQLPFFILQELYDFVFDDSSSYNNDKEVVQRENEIQNKAYVPFLKLCRNYFSCYEKKQKNSNSRREVKHFTDLVRNFHIADNLNSTGKIRHLYCATKLDEAGVKFKAVQERSLLDIKFRKDRNLMALEQCHYPKQAYISSYILLLDYLINTEKDVDLLVERKAIVNRLGSDEAVAKLVNKLGHQIVECKSCYFDLSEKLNGHYENFWNRNMASLTTVYFRDIWRGTATVVGLMVLFLTIWNIFLRHYVKFK
ncbi:hypothetical protein CMV_025590 [Castanea mollissima]|uniref:Uncharacterized protein n=1 Tax=Castanea mollissima TaxID=60419 RepID=A0A8J4QD56_9ROSI|nr:hypothetical protein CMV_025590 [Castanea mollissima]